MPEQLRVPAAPLARAPDWPERLLPPALLLVLAALTAAGCLNAPFFRLDDQAQVTQNSLLAADRRWWEVLAQTHYQQYIPVTLLSFRLNLDLFGPEATWSFRLVNLLIHAASGILLLHLMRRLGLSLAAALFVAAAWTAHPLACETVAWIAERSNALCFFFGAAAFYIYVRWHGRWLGVAGAAAAFLLALLSKPLALGWLPIFVALEALGGPARLAGDATARSSWRAAVVRLAPLAALALVFTGVGVWGYSSEAGTIPQPGGTWYAALMTDTEILARYLANILVPTRLSAMYGVDDITSVADPRLWVYTVVLAAAVGGSLWLADSRRRALFGWLWFLGGLGPSANLVAIGYPMQDRYVYLSSAGALLVVVECGRGVASRWRLRERLGPRGAVLGPALAAVYVLALGALAWDRGSLWGDSPALMAQGVERQPRSALARVFYAYVLDQRADERRPLDPQGSLADSHEVVAQLSEALTLPDFPRCNPIVVRLTLARNAVRIGQPRRAIQWMEGLLPSPDDPDMALEARRSRSYCIRRFGPYDFPYCFQLGWVAEGYLWLGEAELSLFRSPDTANEEAAGWLRRAAEHGRFSADVNANCTEIWFYLARTGLASEALQEKGPLSERVDVARARLGAVQPSLDYYATVREVEQVLRPPLPFARGQVLGRLAMAHAAFMAAQSPGTTPEERAGMLKSARAWAERAAVGDPTFSEVPWFQARLSHFLAEQAAAAQDERGARALQQESVSFLSKVAPGSPRYEQAQKNLRGLRGAAGGAP